MKASLVIRGGPFVPDLEKAKAYGINELVFEADDPALRDNPAAATKLFADLRAKPERYKIRVMRDVGWPSSGGTPAHIAQAMSDDITRYGGGREGESLSQLSSMYDGEVPHDSNFHLAVINGFFLRRSGRSLVWTLEGLQAGWISDELVDRINNTPLLTVSPQTYKDKMQPLFIQYVIENLAGRGIRREKIQPFIRPDRADEGWYGIVYDHAKLP